ncbi:hypothetical protein DXG01_000918 [Tephrocybe rancida]|nr:hypothetical protein DXG01_000918 [Tephrocybe rancida]
MLMQLSNTAENDTGGQQFNNTTIDYNHAERGSFFDNDGDTVMYSAGDQPPGLHLAVPLGLSFDAPPGLHPAAPGYPAKLSDKACHVGQHRSANAPDSATPDAFPVAPGPHHLFEERDLDPSLCDHVPDSPSPRPIALVGALANFPPILGPKHPLVNPNLDPTLDPFLFHPSR